MKQRSPEYTKLSILQNKIVAIEGPIGVGKSTLGAALHAYALKIGLNSRFEPECVDTGYLALYLKSEAKMAQHAFGFQKDTLQGRIAVHERSEKFAARGGSVFIDRGVLGDIAFAKMQHDKGMFDDEEWASYGTVVDRARVHEPSVVLHLVCDAETLLERIRRRSRNGETIYTKEYLEAHHAATVAVLKEHYRGEVIVKDWSPALTVSGNHDVEISDEMCFNILSEIARVLLRPVFALMSADICATLAAAKAIAPLAVVPVKRWAVEDDPAYSMVVESAAPGATHAATVHFEDGAGRTVEIGKTGFLLEEVEVDANGVEVSWTEALPVGPEYTDPMHAWALEEGKHYRLSDNGQTLFALVPRTARTAVTPHHLVVPVPKVEEEYE